MFKSLIRWSSAQVFIALSLLGTSNGLSTTSNAFSKSYHIQFTTDFFGRGLKTKFDSPQHSKLISNYLPRGEDILLRAAKSNNDFNSLSEMENKLEDETMKPEKYISVILPLLLVYISNQWSRFSLSYLVDFSDGASPESAMNVALQFSEAQYGALASIAFTALFAIASLLAGNLADNSDRKLLTSLACFGWSIATLLTATAGGYTQVLVARVAMGLACAFATPNAYTLIQDLIPKTRVALASSIYGSGVYLGGALSSLSILLDQNFGWREALTIIAFFGFASSALSALILPSDPSYKVIQASTEPNLTSKSTSKPLDTTESSSLISVSLSILSSTQIQLLFLASFLRFSAGLSIAVWAAPYFRLAFPDSASSYALANALIVGFGGVTSGVLGGALADFAGTKALESGMQENTGRMIVPIIGSMLGVPAWWFCIHSTSFTSAMIWLAAEYLVAECWFGPVVTVLQSSIEKGKGGTAQGLFTLTGAIGNLAPSLLGILYGMRNTSQGIPDDLALSNLLSLFVCGGYFFSAIIFALSVKSAQSNSVNLKES